jgi:CheY-like chemotaxis protein
VTVSAPSSSRARARDVDPARLVSVLDVDGSWGDVTVDAHDVSVVAPSDDLAEALVGTVPARVVVNLAAAGALHALTTLRAAGSTARFWGCIADAASDRVLPLGMLEPATKPVDPDAIVEILGRYTVRGTRVVTAGADVDGLMSLRQALARRGLSVSMAWDAKQAADLLQVVRPEVVVIDLGLPRRDGYGIVARLASVDPVPSAVVLPGAEDTAIGFVPVLADGTHAGRMLTMKQFLAGVLAANEEPPADRRPKVRVMGRK